MIILFLISPSGRFMLASTTLSDPTLGAFKVKDFCPIPEELFLPFKYQVMFTISRFAKKLPRVMVTLSPGPGLGGTTLTEILVDEIAETLK